VLRQAFGAKIRLAMTAGGLCPTGHEQGKIRPFPFHPACSNSRSGSDRRSFGRDLVRHCRMGILLGTPRRPELRAPVEACIVALTRG
jgi:hypothetical protein